MIWELEFVPLEESSPSHVGLLPYEEVRRYVSTDWARGQGGECTEEREDA